MKIQKLIAYLLTILSLLILLPQMSGGDPLDNWHVRQIGGDLNASAYGNGIFVAVGGSRILISPDGINFTLVNAAMTPHNLTAITYNNNLFVTVGKSGTILTSMDGIMWTNRNSGVSCNLRGVTYGNGLFMAVGDGGNIVTSPDGINWTWRDSRTAYNLSGVGYGNESFVAVGYCYRGVDFPEPALICGSSVFLTSTDGINWTKSMSEDGYCLEGITYGNNTFVAVGYPGIIYTSPDGINWTRRNSGGDYFLPKVAYGNGTFVTLGEEEGGNFQAIVLTSSDGVNWTKINLETSFWLSGITYGNNTFLAVGTNSTILTSSDGAIWTNRSLWINQGDVIYVNGTFVAAAGGSILSSPDGVVWTSKDLGISCFLDVITYGNGTFVAIGSGGGEPMSVLILTSTDGVIWERAASIPLDYFGWLNSVTYGNGLFVAVGREGGNHGIVITSPDGVNWTKITLEGFSFPGLLWEGFGLNKVTYGNGMFVAVGGLNGPYGYGYVATSTDGVNWKARQIFQSTEGLTMVAFGNGTFVSAGGSGTILTSPDGVNWTIRTSVDIDVVTYANGTFVALGGGIFTSPDGINWTKRTGGFFYLQAIAFGNNTFLAVGGAIIQSDPVAASQYLLTLVKPGKGNGTITSSPVGIDCGSGCTEMYNAGSEVTLVATPSADSIFTGWSGACSGTDTTCTVTIMNGPNFVMANFDKAPESVSTPTIPDGATSGIIDTPYSYTTGSSTSNYGHPVEYQFDWNGDGSDLSSWGPASLSKTWATPAVYNVKARARCSQDLSVVSDWSSVLTVRISVPKISVTPAVYDYGNIKANRAKKASFSVNNDGTVNLTLSSSIVGADASMFRIRIGGGSRTIKPGKILAINVAFRPTSAGLKQATLRITSNDPGAPIIDILLNGKGM